MSAKINFSLARFFQALGDPTRLRLLHLIAGHEVCVCHLVRIVACPQPKISRHLAYLRSAGIVAARREGKWMHYRICASAGGAVDSILAAVLAALGRDQQMRADRAKLDPACCDPQKRIDANTR